MKDSDKSTSGIVIRDAHPEDAPLIAKVVAMGIGYDETKSYAGYDFLTAIEDVARQPDTQYSYRNTLIAERDEFPVAAAVSYDGASLHPLREKTLKIIHKYNPTLHITDDETAPGELYLDSLAVLPEMRGAGIGKMLINATIEKAKLMGHTHVGLLVDFENPDAERLYSSLGFIRVGTRPFFGHDMKHMQLSLTKEE